MTDVDVKAAASDSPPPAAPKRVPGEEGTWIFIFGDMCVFAVLFCVFLQARITDSAGFARDQAQLNQNLGAVNTVLLLVSSLLVVLATRCVQSTAPALRARAPRLILGAWLCGVAFLVVKVVEYGEKVQHGVTPQTSDFFMYYFVLTGLHAVHLLLGLAFLTVLFKLARKPEMSRGQFVFFEGAPASGTWSTCCGSSCSP